MNNLTISELMDNVESNLSSIYTKQDVLNLLSKINVEDITTNSEIHWRNSSNDYQMLYENEAKRRQDTISYNDLLEHRLNDLKQSMWAYFVNHEDSFDDNEENLIDSKFADNIRIANIASRDEYTHQAIDQAIDQYKIDNKLVNWDELYDNFRDRVNGFEFDDICTSCDFEINRGNEIHISSADINTNHICDELEFAYENVK